MIFGNPTRERLQLNEESLWAGGPHDYAHPGGAEVLPEIRRLVFAGEWEQAQKLVSEKFMGIPVRQSPYQTLGDLYLDFGDGEFREYSRFLDIDAATVTTEYVRDGVRYTRTHFASYSDDVIVVRITADKPGAVAFTARYETPQPETRTVAREDTLSLSRAAGTPDRIAFHAAVRCLPEGKNATLVAGDDGTLVVRGADAATLHLGMATAYNSYKDVSADAAGRVRKRLDAVRRKSYADLHTICGAVIQASETT